MANLPETPQWEEGVYQIEVSDPVLGGPDGISNRQAKQLASRTSYLKQKVEKGGTDLAAHIAAADPHTQYAPKASPTFTGTPTAPTPAANDNSKKLVTTEFVARAIAALAGTAPETLDTLKELADALGNDPNFATTVLNKLAEKLAKDQNGADIPNKAAFLQNLGLGEAATRNVGTDTGQVPDMSSFTTGHSGAADWPNPKSGWSKGPDGVITQWGIFGFPVGQTGTNVVFPLPFPAWVESITLTMADIQESLLSPTTMPAYGVNSNGTSRTGFTARMSGSGGFNLCYIAKGR
ncbi:gp53-like domain-containing protein [Enterobacter hormaechei]|uniref:gp53-like domain-containing protein n=1 Tax=Enterobacter hormaechei TaxID=158836 RepID=UPI002017BAB1|nr:phage tail protein [Enterobacter hormaechei]